jgi:hypothetical protein
MQRVSKISWRHFWPPPAVAIFFEIPHKRCNFREKVIEHKMCVLIFSTNFVWNISPSENLTRYRQKCRNVFMESIRYSCRILMKLEFSRQIFGKEPQIVSFIKIRTLGAQPSHAYRQTWRSSQSRFVILRTPLKMRLRNEQKKMYLQPRLNCSILELLWQYWL